MKTLHPEVVGWIKYVTPLLTATLRANKIQNTVCLRVSEREIKALPSQDSEKDPKNETDIWDCLCPKGIHSPARRKQLKDYRCSPFIGVMWGGIQKRGYRSPQSVHPISMWLDAD